MNKELEQANLPEQTQEDAGRLRQLIARSALALGILGGVTAISVAEAEPAEAACWIEWIDDSQGNSVPIQKCDDEPVTTTPPPDKPVVTQPPKPDTIVTTPPEVDVDGDGFLDLDDHNDNSPPKEGELETVGALPYGEDFLNQTTTNTRGEEVAVRDYLEQAATDSLPDDLRIRLNELIEYASLQEQMYSANINVDGDNYKAGPNDGQFSKLLHEAGMFAGDLDDKAPGSLDLVAELRSAGIELSDPVTVVLTNGEEVEFSSGFKVLLHVGKAAYDRVPAWAIAVDILNNTRAEQEATKQAEINAQNALEAAAIAVEAATQAELEAEATNIDNELLPAPEAEELALGIGGAGGSANIDQEQTGILDNTGWRIILSGGFLASIGAWFANRRIGKRNDELEAKQQALNEQIVKEPEQSDDIVPKPIPATLHSDDSAHAA